MLQLAKSLDPTRYTPRMYVVAHSDFLSEEKARQFEQEHMNQGEFKIVKIARARHVGQSWSTVPFSVLKGIFSSLQVLMKFWPDMIFSVKRMEIIYIESFARVYNLSLTGKLLYPFVDRFLVQWPELSNRLKRAEYKGILV
ncbi:oligosaccharide biosynthesis protein Alg14 like-domain-containing protein [Blakeslea trispora]|nr:oligosaccharide biosynthesis protein Alg14 like-domain-containing protein [Blakeslea trispora]